MDPIDKPEYSLPPSQMSVRIPRTLNKAPADIQITAEQLLKEALANQIDDIKPPRIQINDEEELDDYLHRKRAEFENNIRKQRPLLPNWFKYAAFEEGLGDFVRARSVWERAINVDYKNPTLWVKYAEMEMRHKFVNHARNIWERAISLLPRVDQIWYKYAYMEEILGNYNGARNIFERWMKIQPTENAWIIYAKFEERMGELDNARKIMYRMIEAQPTVHSFIKVAKFEEKHRNRNGARKVYESAIAELGPDANNEDLFLEFSEFEIRCREIERARLLFKYALEKISKQKAPKLYQRYIDFEKQHGSKTNIELVVLNKRRAYYEKLLSENPMAYDLWFDYIKLEESEGITDRIRETYERAIANVPPSTEKKHWRRYIFFWINYSVFEENIGEIERARQIYTKTLEVIPNKHFSFAKVWILYSHFELRQLDIDKARKILGTAIGKCGSEKIFEAYIELEMQLGNIDRCRKLHEKWIEIQPTNTRAWIQYGELEKNLQEMQRCRAIYELAISQPVIDTPEMIWKSYIDLEISENEHEKVRDLYDKLLTKTKHMKVWVSYAQFEISVDRIERARQILAKADSYFKSTEDKESRLLLLETWLELENSMGDEQEIASVQAKLPRKVKKRRKIEKFGEEIGWEEYLDYIFPDEEKETRTLKIVEMAHLWKNKMENNS